MPGVCDPLFSPVAGAFAANFAAGLDVGAACAVVVDGRLVVDLWGGVRSPGGPAWEADTMVETRSATKGPVAACLHILVDRGLVDLDAPVRRYWPELRCEATVQQALTHEAGIPIIDAPLPEGAVLAWDTIADAVARQEPLWEPGERQGYHGVTFAWLVGEVVRRVSGRSIGRFLRDAVTGPLDADYFVGTPTRLHHRIAPLVAAPPRLDGRPTPPNPMSSIPPDSLAARMFRPLFAPVSPGWNTAAFRSAEIPCVNGIGTARGLATIYGELARDGGCLLSAEAAARLTMKHTDGTDAVLGIPVRRSLGFELPREDQDDGRPVYAFGHPGASGFLGFADPHARLGFAYVKNADWNGDPGQDTRARDLVRATYASLRS